MMVRKKPGPTARRRKTRAAALKRGENKNKAKVRARDRVCRFPLCPCQRFGLFLEVSHATHKGMGGDPTGERSAPELMILVCNWRHKESHISIDKKAIRWLPLTDKGSNGPVEWQAKADEGGEWITLAREESIGRWLPIDPWQRALLHAMGTELSAHVR